jgi:hypothetical protein
MLRQPITVAGDNKTVESRKTRQDFNVIRGIYADLRFLTCVLCVLRTCCIFLFVSVYVKALLSFDPYSMYRSVFVEDGCSRLFIANVKRTWIIM